MFRADRLIALAIAAGMASLKHWSAGVLLSPRMWIYGAVMLIAIWKAPLGTDVQYVLLKPFRVFVTVNVPSVRADTLIQYAFPL